jgi:hypothetical protein
VLFEQEYLLEYIGRIMEMVYELDPQEKPFWMAFL